MRGKTVTLLLLLVLATGGCGSQDVIASDPRTTEVPSETTPSEDTPTQATPSEAAPTETSPTEVAATVPADLPLDLDLPADGGDYEVTAPSAEADGIGDLEVCGSVVWPPGRAEARLATSASGPEHVDARELVVPDAAVAATVVPRVREVVAGCTDAPDHQVWTLHEADTGHESVTFSLTWSVGLGASVFQVTRVGDALLMTHRYGEGMLETIDPTVRERTALTREIAPAMCALTPGAC
ncbi:hypothetical protein [Nocardioides sediminis]|uniref:hypothetical protein n=1 Tax=Nocardioides sediminis TaxID=433648 RepID=UPI000D32162B|nr:hypothetical protein [Nocardioides sediminis]